MQTHPDTSGGLVFKLDTIAGFSSTFQDSHFLLLKVLHLKP